MVTLALDTSTSQGSVAVLREDQLICHETFSADRSHGATVFCALERARACATAIDQVVVGLGPGSYAGVRISIAAAIGLELALGATLVGIPSVAAFTTGVERYIAVGDARRQTWYYTLVFEGSCVEGPLLATESELRSLLGSNPTVPVFASAPLPAVPTAQPAFPSAILLARLALAGRGIVGAGNLQPIYLREPHITYPKKSQP